MKHFVVKSIVNYAVAFYLSDDDDSYGWGNGYVIVPEGHPAYGKHYEELNQIIDVHGGLTFSALVTDSILEQSPGLSSEDLGKWIVGFDTMHYGDGDSFASKKDVEEETLRLFNQLKEM